MSSATAAVAELYRRHYRDVVAPLIRVLGSFEAAEDAAQAAFAKALAAWERDGMPDEPLAWVRRVARNGALDVHRRQSRWRDRAAAIAAEAPGSLEPDLDLDGVSDDLLRLVFTCCHPSLSPEAQVALTLHTVCGLTSDEVARAFLVPRTTLQQRLVRAKRKIDRARIPYVVPSRDDLPERVASVLRTIYLVFNEGYGATASDALVRRDLCDEAIRLARLVEALVPGAAAPRALLALMLLHHARTPARTDAAGELVLLEHQDRSLWDGARIAEALPLVEASLRARPLPDYAVEAAIAALHARAPTPEQTDWAQIAALYAVLVERSGGSPVVRLNAAVAVAMAGDAEEGLRRLDALDAEGALAHYHLLPAARGGLLARLGRIDDARGAYTAARALAANAVERRYLERRLAELSVSPSIG